VDKVERDGRTGTNGLGRSADYRSGTPNASGAAGFYARGMKAVPRRKNLRTPFARRHAGPIGMLIVFVAACLVVSSVVAVAQSGKEVTKSLARPPGFPYTVFGYTYDTVNGTVLAGVNVTITNVNTGEYFWNDSDADGYYTIDLNEPTMYPTGAVNGDIINITAVKGTYIGWAEGVVDDTLYPFTWIDVILNDVGAIPEFPMVIVPVLGMAAMVAVVSLRRRRGEL
jgi:hypothetical protein